MKKAATIGPFTQVYWGVERRKNPFCEGETRVFFNHQPKLQLAKETVH